MEQSCIIELVGSCNLDLSHLSGTKWIVLPRGGLDKIVSLILSQHCPFY